MTKRCKHCGRMAEFYLSNPYRCKACFKQASKASYKKRRAALKTKYRRERTQRLEYARASYRASKHKYLMRVRLYYRTHKAHPSLDDHAIIEELRQILVGTKAAPDHCAWCGNATRIDPVCPEAEKVQWLCFHCRRELRTKTILRQHRAIRAESRPRLPLWLRRIVGRGREPKE